VAVVVVVFGVALNKDNQDVQDLILNRPSAPLNHTVPSTITATAPLSNIPPTSCSPHVIYSSNQNNDVATTDNLWATSYNRRTILGDGDCFFSALNCCMRFLDQDW